MDIKVVVFHGNKQMFMFHLLAVGETCKAIFRPTQGFKERNFDSLWSSAELNLCVHGNLLQDGGGRGVGVEEKGS